MSAKKQLKLNLNWPCVCFVGVILSRLFIVVVLDPNAKEGRRYEIRTRLHHHVPRELVQDGERTRGNSVSC